MASKGTTDKPMTLYEAIQSFLGPLSADYCRLIDEWAHDAPVTIILGRDKRRLQALHDDGRTSGFRPCPSSRIRGEGKEISKARHRYAALTVEKGPKMPKLAVIKHGHAKRTTKTVGGVTFTQTHSGQKHAYGDSYYEFDVESMLPAAEVERICREQVYECNLTEAQWRADDKSMESHFRRHYAFKNVGEGRYQYSVCFPYTD